MLSRAFVRRPTSSRRSKPIAVQWQRAWRSRPLPSGRRSCAEAPPCRLVTTLQPVSLAVRWLAASHRESQKGLLHALMHLAVPDPTAASLREATKAPAIRLRRFGVCYFPASLRWTQGPPASLCELRKRCAHREAAE